MRKAKEKLKNYAILLRDLEMLYQDYRFEMITVIIGAKGCILEEFKVNLEKLNFDEKEEQNSGK